MMEKDLQDIALGIAQVRFWELSKCYNLMMAELSLSPVDDVDAILVDPGRIQIALDWLDFSREHDGWSFLLFDPSDINRCIDSDIQEIEIEEPGGFCQKSIAVES